MKERQFTNRIFLNIYASLKFFIIFVLPFAGITIGGTGMDQPSSNHYLIENLIDAVSATYSRVDHGKILGTGLNIDDSINMNTNSEVEVNSTQSVISTTSDQLSTSIVPHPTISYINTETNHYVNGRAFATPHFRMSDARWGPYFEEGTELQNISANLGATVILDCRIGLLHDKTVTWLHHKDNSIHLLTVGRTVYSSDERITLSFKYPNNWRLVIVYVSRNDEGLYECQVATHPPKVKRQFLKIFVPEVCLIDELGREITERYYKEGSTLELTCLSLQTDNMDDSIYQEIVWKHGDETVHEGISFNTSLKSNAIASTLVLTPIERQHSGNYTCAINGLTSTTVSIHVLNGESPAAVIESNGDTNQSDQFSVWVLCLCAVYCLFT